MYLLYMFGIAFILQCEWPVNPITVIVKRVNNLHCRKSLVDLEN
jgi:hypothetical protein